MYHTLPQRGVGAPHFDARCAEEADIRSIRAVLPQGSRYSSIAQYFDKEVVVPLPKTKTFANSMFAFPRYHHHYVSAMNTSRECDCLPGNRPHVHQLFRVHQLHRLERKSARDEFLYAIIHEVECRLAFDVAKCPDRCTLPIAVLTFCDEAGQNQP